MPCACTPGYTPPELLEHCCTTAIDIWACGIVTALLVCIYCWCCSSQVIIRAFKAFEDGNAWVVSDFAAVDMLKQVYCGMIPPMKPFMQGFATAGTE